MEKKAIKEETKKRKSKLLAAKEKISTSKSDDEYAFPSSEDDGYSDDDTSKVTKIKKRRRIDMAERLCGLTDLLRSRVSHMLIPAFNVGLEAPDNFEELQNFPILKFTAPQPIYVANRFPAATDICYHRTINYEYHKHLLLCGRTRYLGKFEKSKNVQKLEEQGIYSNLVFNFAERYNSDPDKYFKSFFDYYYTGGNLNILPTDSKPVVLHATGEFLNNLNVSKYEKNRKLLNLYKNTETERSDNEEVKEIFELKAFPTQNAENPKFIMRKRNELKVLRLMANKAAEVDEEEEQEAVEDEKSVEELFCFQANVPFISFTHLPKQEHLLLTSNMRQQIRQYSIDEGGARMLQLYNINRDEATQNYVNSWNILRAYNEHNCFYANGEQLLFMDLRTTPAEWLQVKCRNTHNVLPCDRISTLAVSQHEPLLYVGTYHNLHCLDIRKMRPDLSDEASSICCFTHQMAYPPVFIDTLRHESRDFVALSSAVAGEVRICELQCGAKYTSYCLPYQPPTLKEAYDHAKLTGRCLQVGADLPKRLKCCTTGLAFYTHIESNVGDGTDKEDASDEEDNRPLAHLLMSNSNGDVFAQHVFKRENCQEVQEQRVNNTSDEKMHKFAEDICEKSTHVLQFTDICNVIGLNRIFRCKNLSKPAECYEDIEKPVRRRLGRWQKSVAALKQYKDALAQDILAIWDVEAEDERDLMMSQLPKELKKKPNSENMVDNWLKLGTIIPPSMTVVPRDVDTSLEETPNMLYLPQSTQINFDDIKIENADIATNGFLVGDIINMDDLGIPIETLNTSVKVELMENNQNVTIINGLDDVIRTTTTTTTITKASTTLQNTTQGSNNPRAKKKAKKYVKGF